MDIKIILIDNFIADYSYDKVIQSVNNDPVTASKNLQIHLNQVFVMNCENGELCLIIINPNPQHSP